MTGAERREPVQRLPAQGEVRSTRLTLLDVVVGQGSSVLELLSSEDESLLVGGDALLVLDLGLDIVDRVRGLDLKGDGLAGEAVRACIRGVEGSTDDADKSERGRSGARMGLVSAFAMDAMEGRGSGSTAAGRCGRGGRTQAKHSRLDKDLHTEKQQEHQSRKRSQH